MYADDNSTNEFMVFLSNLQWFKLWWKSKLFCSAKPTPWHGPLTADYDGWL